MRDSLSLSLDRETSRSRSMPDGASLQISHGSPPLLLSLSLSLSVSMCLSMLSWHVWNNWHACSGSLITGAPRFRPTAGMRSTLPVTDCNGSARHLSSASLTTSKLAGFELAYSHLTMSQVTRIPIRIASMTIGRLR